jgi:secreted Zn-dependent insulinase-like peptidase
MVSLGETLCQHKRAALDKIDSAMVATLSDLFFSDVHVELLVFGNAMRQGVAFDASHCIAGRRFK